jgi:hypothetical protein
VWTVAQSFSILISICAAIGLATAWWARRRRTD